MFHARNDSEGLKSKYVTLMNRQQNPLISALTVKSGITLLSSYCDTIECCNGGETVQSHLRQNIIGFMIQHNPSRCVASLLDVKLKRLVSNYVTRKVFMFPLAAQKCAAHFLGDICVAVLTETTLMSV